MDVLHSEVEEGKKYYYCLLLIPSDVVCDRKVIDAFYSKYFLKLKCYNRK